MVQLYIGRKNNKMDNLDSYAKVWINGQEIVKNVDGRPMRFLQIGGKILPIFNERAEIKPFFEKHGEEFCGELLSPVIFAMADNPNIVYYSVN